MDPNCLGTLDACDAPEKKSAACLLLCCSRNATHAVEAHTACLLQWVQNDEQTGPPTCPWCKHELCCQHAAWQEFEENGLLYPHAGAKYNFLRAHGETAVAEYVATLQTQQQTLRTQHAELQQRYALLRDEWVQFPTVLAFQFEYR